MSRVKVIKDDGSVVTRELDDLVQNDAAVADVNRPARPARELLYERRSGRIPILSAASFAGVNGVAS